MLIEKAFQTSNHRIGLDVTWKPRRKSGVANIFGLQEHKDNESKQFDLVLSILWRWAVKQHVRDRMAERDALCSRVSGAIFQGFRTLSSTEARFSELRPHCIDARRGNMCTLMHSLTQ